MDFGTFSCSFWSFFRRRLVSLRSKHHPRLDLQSTNSRWWGFSLVSSGCWNARMMETPRPSFCASCALGVRPRGRLEDQSLDETYMSFQFVAAVGCGSMEFSENFSDDKLPYLHVILTSYKLYVEPRIHIARVIPPRNGYSSNKTPKTT